MASQALYKPRGSEGTAVPIARMHSKHIENAIRYHRKRDPEQVLEANVEGWAELLAEAERRRLLIWPAWYRYEGPLKPPEPITFDWGAISA